jgi:hypothetical protein
MVMIGTRFRRDQKGSLSVYGVGHAGGGTCDAFPAAARREFLDDVLDAQELSASYAPRRATSGPSVGWRTSTPSTRATTAKGGVPFRTGLRIAS